MTWLTVFLNKNKTTDVNWSQYTITIPPSPLLWHHRRKDAININFSNYKWTYSQNPTPQLPKYLTDAKTKPSKLGQFLLKITRFIFRPK